jgi:hypothetical protein
VGMKFIILTIFISIISFCYVSSQQNLFDEIKKTTDLKVDELLIVNYQNPSTCIKCYLEPMDLINYIEKIKGNKKIKYLAMVKCDREIELNVFKRETGWKYYMYVDEGDASEKLKAESKTILSILNFKGENLLNLQGMRVLENIEKIKKFLEVD